MIRKILSTIATLFVAAGAITANAQTSITASAIADAFNRPINGKLCFAPVDPTGAATGFRVGSVQVVTTPVCGTVSNGVLQAGLVVEPTPTGVYYKITANNRTTNAVLRDYGMTPITGSSWSLDSYDPATAVIPIAAITSSATSLPAGSAPTATLAGSGPYTLTLGIPKGDTGATGPTGPTGPAATVAVGTTTTGGPGTSASVTNSGTSGAAVFNFTVPQGPVGLMNSRGSWAATTAYAVNDVFVQSGTAYVVTSAYTSGSTFGATDTAHAQVVGGYTGVAPDGASGLAVTGNVGSKTLQNIGLISNSAWGTGTNNLAGFFGNTTYCNGSGKPCFGIVDPSYANTEHYNLTDNNLMSGTSMGASQAMLMDFRNGALTLVSHDPKPNIYDGGTWADAFRLGCNNTTFQGTVGGTGGVYAQQDCMHLTINQRAPGFSIGNPSVGPSGWSVESFLQLQASVSTPGIDEGITVAKVKSGVGDTTPWYSYNWNYGGAVSASDEGNEMGIQGGETNVTYAGTINSSTTGTGLTTVKVNCTKDCQNPGDGRYLVRTQSAVATGNITNYTNASGFTPGTFTVDATVTPSVMWGTLSANVVTPLLNSSPFSTSMTFTVNALGGSAPSVGDLLCFAGQFHEQTKITAVSGSGPYTITAPLRRAHESGSWVMDGGLCGTFIDITANDVAPANQRLAGGAGQTIHYPVDVLGATDSHTLVVRYFVAAGPVGTMTGASILGAADPITRSATAMTNVGGIVTFNFSGGVPASYWNLSTITFSGASDSAFNGSCTNMHRIFTGNTFACSQSSSIGHSGPATASVNVGNTGFNLWSGAEVLDVLNEATAPPSIDGTLTLEPNNMALASGDAVEESHHYAAHERLIFGNLNITDPIGWGNVGMAYAFGGEGVSGGLPYGVTSFALEQISNTNSSSIYQGHGGTLLTPNGISLQGPIGTALQMQYAPDYHMPFAYIGPPVSGSSDAAYYYDLLDIATGKTSQTTAIGVSPFAGSLNFQVPVHFYQAQDSMTFDNNLYFGSLAQPSNNGSYAFAGGTLADSTTYYYKVVATNDNGAGLASNEFSVTTGSNGGANGVRVQWTKVPGATGYTVCRSTTSGAELEFYQNFGGYNGDTLYVDDLGVLINGGGGSCPGTTDSSRGGIDWASHIGLTNSTNSYYAKLVAPSSFSGYYTETLPATATTGQLVDIANSTTTVAGDVVTFSNTTGRVQDSGKQLAGTGAGITTGPTSSTVAGDLVTFNGTTGQIQDSGVKGPTKTTSASIGGSALAAGACSSTTVIATTGSSTVVEVTPQTYPGAGFYWRGYVSATNTVTVEVCAAVAGTPTASVYNVEVFQ